MLKQETPLATPARDLAVTAETYLPHAGKLWWRGMVLAWIFLGAFLVDRLCLLLMDYWLLQSLGYESVFWTNFKTGALLFAAGLLSSLFIIGPAFAYDVGRRMRKIILNGGLVWGLLAGYFLCLRYIEFLMAGGQDFGRLDKVFSNDIGFYVFDLPPIWTAWWFLFGGTFLALLSWTLCAYVSRPETELPEGMTRLGGFFGAIGTRGTRITFGIFTFLAAAGWWLARYDVLLADNSASSIFTGASYVDVTGLFSTVNDYWFTALVTLALGGTAIAILGRYHHAVRGGGNALPQVRKLALAMLILLCADFGFKALVSVRQVLFVTPNEPVIQMEYIAEHVEATRLAYNLGEVETIPFIPKDKGDPLPTAQELLASPTLRNAPLWPGFCSYLEDLVDIQHQERIVQTGGDALIYGPLLEIFRQQQKLRAYYNFLDIDTIRYRVDGEPRMVVSSVREVPLVEPAPWLAWWGQQFMLFTHGYGLVTASATEVSPEGNPVYVSKGLPVTTDVAALRTGNQRVYYGEGSGSMAYSNVKKMRELDYPTDEGRATIELPKDVKAGVQIDSLLKRLVFGYKSGQFFEIVFSDLINDDTRVHYYRTPLQRLERLVPFLFFDSDPYAVASDDKIVWMVNCLTYSDSYPYSEYKELGDKSDVRTPFPQEHFNVNYVADSVKASVDGYTGEIKLYQFSDEPVVATLAEIYPGVLRPRSEMPQALKDQLQYPVQLMHIQFDDLYIVYQMRDTMTFFNMEDMWDDGDEVLGPIMDQGKAIRFSIEPFYTVLETGDGLLPEAKQKTQFAMAMVFTPEKALNLRAIPIVYQDGEDYGRLVCLQVPKGHYYIGPEQADANIDQEPEIAQQITWWTRRGVEVIRGHTTTLLVKGEVIYVEPLFLRSQQNPVTQLKKVCVVFRGKAVMRDTLEEALSDAIAWHHGNQVAAGGG